MLFEKLSQLFKDDSASQPEEGLFKIFSDDEKSTNDTRISEVIDWTKTKSYLARLSISEDNAEVVFRSMLVEHNLPEELRKNEPLRGELKRVVIEEAGKNAPLRPDEANLVKELLASGEIFRDIFYSSKVIFSLAKPDRFFRLDDSFKNHLKTIIKLPNSIISDLNPNNAFDMISTQIAQLKAGETPNDPDILNNTLKTIYSTPEIGNIIDVISALLAPKNETLRITLTVYARLNGINLGQQDIDKARDTM